MTRLRRWILFVYLTLGTAHAATRMLKKKKEKEIEATIPPLVPTPTPIVVRPIVIQVPIAPAPSIAPETEMPSTEVPAMVVPATTPLVSEPNQTVQPNDTGAIAVEHASQKGISSVFAGVGGAFVMGVLALVVVLVYAVFRHRKLRQLRERDRIAKEFLSPPSPQVEISPKQLSVSSPQVESSPKQSFTLAVV